MCAVSMCECARISVKLAWVFVCVPKSGPHSQTTCTRDSLVSRVSDTYHLKTCAELVLDMRSDEMELNAIVIHCYCVCYRFWLACTWIDCLLCCAKVSPDCWSFDSTRLSPKRIVERWTTTGSVKR